MVTPPRREPSEIATLVEEILIRHPDATIPFVAVNMGYSSKHRVLDDLRIAGRWDLHRKLSRRKKAAAPARTIAMVVDAREVLPNVTLKTCAALLGYKAPSYLRKCLQDAGRRDLLLQFPDYVDRSGGVSGEDTLEDVMTIIEGDPRATCEFISRRLGRRWNAIERALYRMDQDALVSRIKSNNPKRQQQK